jgi:hypothetical protein
VVFLRAAWESRWLQGQTELNYAKFRFLSSSITVLSLFFHCFVFLFGYTSFAQASGSFDILWTQVKQWSFSRPESVCLLSASFSLIKADAVPKVGLDMAWYGLMIPRKHEATERNMPCTAPVSLISGLSGSEDFACAQPVVMFIWAHYLKGLSQQIKLSQFLNPTRLNHSVYTSKKIYAKSKCDPWNAPIASAARLSLRSSWRS